MIKNQKIKIVNELTNLLVNDNSIYLSDFSGIKSYQMSDFRRSCYNSKIKFKIIKNSLFKKAIKKNKDKKFFLLLDLLKGNTSLIYCEKYNNIPAKLIKEFTLKINKPFFKGAYTYDAFYIGGEKINVLVNLKSKKELLSNIITDLKYSIIKVINSLKCKQQKIFEIIQSLLYDDKKIKK